MSSTVHLKHTKFSEALMTHFPSDTSGYRIRLETTVITQQSERFVYKFPPVQILTKLNLYVLNRCPVCNCTTYKKVSQKFSGVVLMHLSLAAMIRLS